MTAHIEHPNLSYCFRMLQDNYENADDEVSEHTHHLYDPNDDEHYYKQCYDIGFYLCCTTCEFKLRYSLLIEFRSTNVTARNAYKYIVSNVLPNFQNKYTEIYSIRDVSELLTDLYNTIEQVYLDNYSVAITSHTYSTHQGI